jgi:hypothetical protein
MANESAVDTWGGRFLDYLGLGLILTATDILVRESALSLAVLLYVVGAVILALGLNWRRIKPRLSGQLVGSVAIIGNDFRYWLAVLGVLVLAARILPIWHQINPIQLVAPAPPTADSDKEASLEAQKSTLVEWLTQTQKERDQAIAERKSAQNGWAADRLTMEAMQSQSGETHRQLVDAEAQKSTLIEWLQKTQWQRDEATKESDQLRKQLQSRPPTETREALCVDLARQLLEGKRMGVGGVDYSERAKNEIREAIKSLNCPR